jgi:hypothetical protein
MPLPCKSRDETEDPNIDPPRVMPTTPQHKGNRGVANAHCRWNKSDAPVPTTRSLVCWPFAPPESTIVVDQEQVGAEGLIFTRSEKALGPDFVARSLRLPEPTFDFTQESE